MAKLPNKKRVHHGDLEFGTFTRIIPSHYVRFSDKTFCLNSSVIEELTNRNCHTLKFVWIKKSEKVVYTIPFHTALETCPIVLNEHGEENLRIPIVECAVSNRSLRTAVQPVEPEAVKENPQARLF